MIHDPNDYVSQDDESEASRLNDLRGVGETNYLNDEEVKQYSLEDFGFPFNKAFNGHDDT